MERQLVWPEWEAKHFFLSLGTPAAREMWWLLWLNALELGRRRGELFPTSPDLQIQS